MFVLSRFSPGEIFCHNTYELKAVTISSSNKHFRYLDDNEQIIIGKSNINEDIFDTIVFADRDIEQVTIPNFIKHIKQNVFEYCDKLKAIEISENSNLISLGKNLLSFSSITNFFIPASVEVIEDGWCRNAYDLTTVTISPQNKQIKYLDDDHKIIVGKSDTNEDIFDTIIFANRDIEQVTIPNFIKYIKPNAFEYCNKLKAIEISENSNLISLSKNLVRFSSITNFFIPASVEVIEDGWCSFVENLKTVTVSPSNKNYKYLDDNEQIIVGKSDKNKDVFDTIIFANRDIKQVTIPNYIKYINSHGFENCDQLNAIEIPEDTELLEIGKQAFACSSLNALNIPKSVTRIQRYAFNNCANLQKVFIEERSELKIFDERLFSFCQNLVQIQIPENSSLKKICASAFYSTNSIENFFIPSNVEEIEDGWCEGADNLKTVTVSPSNKNFKYLDDNEQIIVGKSDRSKDVFDTIIFANRDIKQVTIPNYIKYIKPNAFEYCAFLSNFELQNDSKLCCIPTSIFNNLLIESLFIPTSVEYFHDSWCEGADNLKTVTVSPSNKNFKYLDDNEQIIVGKSDTSKDVFDTIIFANRDIKQVTIPNFIKYIKPKAFENCRLHAFEISDDSKLESINDNLFRYSSIESLFIPASVKKIEDQWCANTPKLVKVTISPSNKNYKYLDDKEQIIVGKSDPNKEVFDTIVFANRNIQQVTIPSYIKYIKPGVFENCTELSIIEFSKDSELVSIGSSSFAFSGIRSITIPKSVCKIEFMAFYCCEKLTKFSLEKGSKLISMKDSIFSSCYRLKTIEIPEESSLQKFCDSFISFTNVEKIFIPSSVKCLKDSWCNYASSLKTVKISPLSTSFKYFDGNHQIIAGKSDENIDVFDTIVFANREIKRATIPNFIEYIKSNAFENCDKLELIEIPDDSEIKSFGKNSFSSTALKNFKVPRKINSYENDFLHKSKNIYCFEFLGDCFVDGKYESIFNELENSIIISFPNVKELNISIRELRHISKGFILLVTANIEINIK